MSRGVVQVGLTLPTADARRNKKRRWRAWTTRALWLGALSLAVSRALRRVEVHGSSMVPTLEEGDRLLVVLLPGRWPLRPGRLVAVVDPREGAGGRLLVKRVAAVGPDGVEVVGEQGAASTDSRDFGPVARGAVVGAAVYRYAPPGRSGRLR